MIKTLGERVEREHSQYLRDSQRIEDRSGGFDVHATSNGVPKLGGTVDFQTLVAGPAMAVASSRGLGTPTMTSVNGAANWEDDVWGSILDGSDVSALRTHVTITETYIHRSVTGAFSTTRKCPTVLTVSGGNHAVPAKYTETTAGTPSTDWFDPAQYAGYCTTPTTGGAHLPSDTAAASILPRKNKKSDFTPGSLLTINCTGTFSDPIAYAVWSHTNTSISVDTNSSYIEYTTDLKTKL